MKLNNKKGFTLVELLAVIVILAIIITIAVPSALSISRKIKQKMYDTKVNMIIKSAQLYGQDHSYNVASTKEDCATDNDRYAPTIKKLVESGYIKKDKDATGTINIINPITGDSMDDLKVCVYKSGRRVKASTFGSGWQS